MTRLIAALLIAGVAGYAAHPNASLAQGARSGENSRFHQERMTIRALREANNRAMAARDVDGTMAIVADDYVLVSGNGEIFRSADAMRATWRADFRDPQRRRACVRHPVTIEVGQVGTTLRAAESGRWECRIANPAGEARYRGSYFAHWVKRGAWRVISDTYVTLGCIGSGCRR